MSLKRRVLKRLTRAARLSVALAALGGGCNFAPRAERPAVEVPAAYKEQSATNLWRVAQPSDDAPRGAWWVTFHDPLLNAFEARVTVSNQNVAAALANVMAARALVREARAQEYPTLGLNPSASRARESSSKGSYPTVNSFDAPLDAAWSLDLWGRVHNAVAAEAATAQASAADLENVRLAAQSDLAADYFQLRAQDTLKALYEETVVAYRKSYELTQVRFKTGLDSDQDVAQAETQLDAAQAASTHLGVLRAQMEHAMAVLLGCPPSAFTVPAAPLQASPPETPTDIPSRLLERRPDIAAAERRVAAANAQIGVARAAFYPTLTLSASGGLKKDALPGLIDWPSRVWSLGAGMGETLYDGGARRAAVDQSRALYDGTVAQYRQTVLTAFQQVEDALSTHSLLGDEIRQQEATVQSSARYLDLAETRYKLGIDSYLNVITAQATLLSNRQTLVNLRTQRMLAAVQLIKALGGGWDASQLPPALDDASHAQPQNP